MELKLDSITLKKNGSVIVIEGKEKIISNEMILREELPTLIEFLKYQMR